jgi:hypothetical protein
LRAFAIKRLLFLVLPFFIPYPTLPYLILPLSYQPFPGGVECDVCPVGFTSPSGGSGAVTCTACAEDTFSSTEGATACCRWCECSCDVNLCSLHAAHANITNQFATLHFRTTAACASGRTTRSDTGSSVCATASACLPGTVISTNTISNNNGGGGGGCSNCAVGTYSSTVDAATCTLCSIGRFAPTVAATACFACAANHYQVGCDLNVLFCVYSRSLLSLIVNSPLLPTLTYSFLLFLT